MRRHSLFGLTSPEAGHFDKCLQMVYITIKSVAD